MGRFFMPQGSSFTHKVQKTKEFYQTPAVEFLNLESEGIICASGDGIIEDWEEDDDPITI